MATHRGDAAKSNLEFMKVKKIQFGILRPREVQALSVVEIKNERIYDDNGLPNHGGINDTRMGTTDKGILCGTCQGDSKECPGHFGHIQLAQPVFHIGYIDLVKKILKCVCYNCYKLLIRPTHEKYNALKKIKDPKLKLAKVYKVCKDIKTCGKPDKAKENFIDGCGQKQPRLRKRALTLRAEFPFDEEETGDDKKDLTPGDCLKILGMISEFDANFMGFDGYTSKPEWLIITKLPVAPPPVRPSVTMGSSMKQEDDLTHQYLQILKANNQLKTNLNTANHIISENAQLLQFYCATLIDNEQAGNMVSRHKSGKAIKAIRSRLKGKEGRLRGNLMGKRVDFSARTVITCDPTLDLDQLGVPRSIAENITIPEVVTHQNFEQLKKLVRNGPSNWPGAKYIIGDGGKMVDLSYARTTEAFLDFGYVVERHLSDGDFVLFNRQPSLHKMSIMGHRVKVLPYSTFRLNLSVTGPYNADFDGDEMNMFVPQSLETKAEVKEIMHIPKQIISPQSNSPVMGIVQDTLAGIMMFTYRDTFLELDMVMQLLMWVEDFDGKIPAPAILKPKPLWTGKQIVSLIIPNINLTKDRASPGDKEDPWSNLKDNRIIIKKGELISGIICKKTVGDKAGGIIHIVTNDQGPEAARDFLSRAQRLINNWLLNFGHTVGVQDTIAENRVLEQIAVTLSKAKEKVKLKLLKAQDGRLKCQPGKDMLETFEAKVNKTLNDARNEAGKLARNSLDVSNKIILMVLAGSKGNDNNISQIMACVGQQNVEGKRIPFGFDRRTLPHFGRDDFGPESRGFVENSYLRGLTPQEFYFHAMGGREGLIDTAVKTSETGYIQRRLEKALEDVMVKYDGTVRNSMEHIIQFLYGEDGIAGEKLEGQKLYLLKMDDKKLEKQCHLNAMNNQNVKDQIKEFMIPENANEVLKNPENVQVSLTNEYKSIVSDRERLRKEILGFGEDDSIYLPINIHRLITRAKQKFDIKPTNRSDLHPFYVIDQLKGLLDTMKVITEKERISKESNDNAVILLKIALRFHLCSKKMILDEKLSKESFDWLLGEIKNKFCTSLAHPGEMVGSIAAQSMGEPATQMTLNTFHSAGISSKNVTLGVPRLKEIINVAKKIKTPSLTIHLKREYSTDANIMREVQSSIEHTTLENVMMRSEIYYDPNPEETIIEEDEDIIDLYKIAPSMEEDIPLQDLSPWLLRFKLDEGKIMERRLDIEEIRDKIHHYYPRMINIMHTDINSQNVIMRIRMKKFDRDSEEELQTLKNLEGELLKSMSLKGFPEITKVYAKTIDYPYYDEDTGAFKRTKKEHWMLETDGVALAKIMNEQYVDFSKTTSNDINEIFTVLGIEAVRKSLLMELRAVLNAYSIYVNYRHISTLCDVMTQRGMLTSITRHGINRIETGALRRCSFEETVEILLEAAAYGEVDYLRGVSENIIMGQLAPMGTGCFDLMLDKEILKSEAIIQAKDIKVDVNSDFFTAGEIDDEPMNTPHPVYTPSQTDMMTGNTSEYNPNLSVWGGDAQFTPVQGEDNYAIHSNPSSPGNYIQTPNYEARSPGYEVRSPIYNGGQGDARGGMTNNYASIASPNYSSMSPSMNPAALSPNYSPTANRYTHASPQYSPTAQNYSASPGYSPTTPSYGMNSNGGNTYSSNYQSPLTPKYNGPPPAAAASPLYNPMTPHYQDPSNQVKKEVKEENKDDY
ncbi:unnamed protein product [Moneuplotes crassus]|uniref:DNA-directed RNA polymerase subunit n=1 Tax=Euplotes crassus TaxID=5936 RepID=A0AAD1Y892_EUPCR|nr:unnamed protein product [Moneuplotes crassus]